MEETDLYQYCFLTGVLRTKQDKCWDSKTIFTGCFPVVFWLRLRFFICWVDLPQVLNIL